MTGLTGHYHYEAELLTVTLQFLHCRVWWQSWEYPIKSQLEDASFKKNDTRVRHAARRLHDAPSETSSGIEKKDARPDLELGHDLL